jgi:uncharacterized protein YchJ
LNADSQWGWGWIGWSDCYRHSRTEFRDLKKSEKLLRQGLSITGVRNPDDIAERLADLCDDQGRHEEAVQFREKGKRTNASVQRTLNIHAGGHVLRQKTTVTFHGEGLPLAELSSLHDLHRPSLHNLPGPKQKIGRNDLCPCGSGKKFKKCCGA